MLTTRFTELVGCTVPIQQAGMGAVSPPELAAAVSNAGGLGVVGATGYTPDELRAMIRKLRSLTDKPFGIDLLLPSNIADTGERETLTASLPEGHVAYVERLRERFGVPNPTPPRHQRPPLTAQFYRDQVRVVLDERVPVFASGLGNPAFMVPEASASKCSSRAGEPAAR